MSETAATKSHEDGRSSVENEVQNQENLSEKQRQSLQDNFLNKLYFEEGVNEKEVKEKAKEIEQKYAEARSSFHDKVHPNGVEQSEEIIQEAKQEYTQAVLDIHNSIKEFNSKYESKVEKEPKPSGAPEGLPTTDEIEKINEEREKNKVEDNSRSLARKLLGLKNKIDYKVLEYIYGLQKDGESDDDYKERMEKRSKRRKRIRVLGGVAIAGACVYKLYSLYSGVGSTGASSMFGDLFGHHGGGDGSVDTIDGSGNGGSGADVDTPGDGPNHEGGSGNQGGEAENTLNDPDHNPNTTHNEFGLIYDPNHDLFNSPDKIREHNWGPPLVDSPEDSKFGVSGVEDLISRNGNSPKTDAVTFYEMIKGDPEKLHELASELNLSDDADAGEFQKAFADRALADPKFWDAKHTQMVDWMKEAQWGEDTGSNRIGSYYLVRDPNGNLVSAYDPSVEGTQLYENGDIHLIHANFNGTEVYWNTECGQIAHPIIEQQTVQYNPTPEYSPTPEYTPTPTPEPTPEPTPTPTPEPTPEPTPTPEPKSSNPNDYVHKDGAPIQNSGELNLDVQQNTAPDYISNESTGNESAPTILDADQTGGKAQEANVGDEVVSSEMNIDPNKFKAPESEESVNDYIQSDYNQSHSNAVENADTAKFPDNNTNSTDADAGGTESNNEANGETKLNLQ